MVGALVIVVGSAAKAVTPKLSTNARVSSRANSFFISYTSLYWIGVCRGGFPGRVNHLSVVRFLAVKATTPTRATAIRRI